MMPPFPSPPLKFRTVGFPQYGYKASLSGETCRPAQGGTENADSRPVRGARPVCRHPSHASAMEERQALSPALSRFPRAAVQEASPLYPRGPWLRPELCCLGPSSLTTAPSASPASTQQLHGLAVYMPRLRCAGAPRRPAGPSLLSLPGFPRVPPPLRRWVRCVLPLLLTSRCQASSRRHPQVPVSPSYTRRGAYFGAAVFASCYGPRVCLALLTGCEPMESRALHRLSEDFVTRAFCSTRCRVVLRVRLDG